MTFEQAIGNYETLIRIGFFIFSFSVFAAWEVFAPRRKLSIRKSKRWLNNLGLLLLSSVMLKIAGPLAAVAIAFRAAEGDWGLLNLWPIAEVPQILIAIVLLDLVIYFQHRLMHIVPLLWRLHRVHHADLDFDVTTGIRFHPLEILFSLAIKVTAVAVIGAPVIAVFIFEILLNISSLFTHSNTRIWPHLDRALRVFVVTPDMHRVHHSVEYDEMNSNFGFNLSLWDRLFKTYSRQPGAGHLAMTLGIPTVRSLNWCVSFWKLLILPFINESTIGKSQSPST